MKDQGEGEGESAVQWSGVRMLCLSGRPIPILHRFARSSSLFRTGRRPAIQLLLSTYHIKWKFVFTAYLCSGSGEGASANQKKASEDALMHHQTKEDQSGRKGILESGLYIVATPIGNLEDITLRALRVLKSSDLILSEDTRHSAKLLQHYNIDAPLLSYHKFNESFRQATILQRLQQNQIVSLISDAGTPGISDPGAKIVRACIEKNIRIYPIPGPTAVITALTASGLPTTAFSFVGFLSPHNSTRKTKLMTAAREGATQIFYVSPHKLLSFLEESISAFGDTRRCVIAREMTKLHEEFWRGTLAEAKSEFSQRNLKGEITLVIEGSEDNSAEAPTEAELESQLQDLFSNGHSLSEAVKLVSKRMSVRKKVVYTLALKMHGNGHKTEKRVHDMDNDIDFDE